MEIIFKGRQTDVPARFREYATAKLNKLERLDQKAIRVDVEVSVERNPRQASQKERVELTVRSRGPAIRAEAAAEDRLAALDLALAKLDSRLRRALDRRKNHYGAGGGAATGASAAQGASGPPGTAARAARSVGKEPGAAELADAEPVWEEPAWEEPPPQAGGHAADVAEPAETVVPIQMEGDGPLVIRQKFHHAKPITIDQALLEMELVGHDFYLFHDVEEDMPSVVYRRHGYQYGVIRLVENAAGRGLAPDASAAGLGAKIPGRRRPEQPAGAAPGLS
jgi:ribosomal subunit interface protein